MSKIFLTIILFLSLNCVNAQITSIAMNVKDLKDAPFKFKGTRAMMVDRINDTSTKNIFVFSKVSSGSIPDTLFAQKFTKIGEVWKLSQEETITHKGAISIWGARKAFFDADKDKNVDVLFIYSLHDAAMQKQLSVNLLLFYKGESYILTETEDRHHSQSENFSGLPQSVKDYVAKYWEGLDKWN